MWSVSAALALAQPPCSQTVTNSSSDDQGSLQGSLRYAINTIQSQSDCAAGTEKPKYKGGPDVVSATSTFTSMGYNLIGQDDGSSGFGFNFNPNDQVGSADLPLDPRLDPYGLQDNGGPTLTIALTLGSSAIDRGTANGITKDQRGFRRAGEGDDQNPDIGAFEFPRGPH